MIEKISNLLKERYPQYTLSVTMDTRHIVTLKGVCDSWQDLVDIGHLVGKLKEVKSVVSDMTVKGLAIPQKDYSDDSKKGQSIGIIKTCDVVIVGAGITGSGIARELSKYDLDVVVVEKGEDVATGATKANNGDIHSGYLEKPGTLKAKLNVKGNKLYDQWAKELNFNFNRKGNLLVITREEHREQLMEAKARADQNGVEAYVIDHDQALALEPIMAEAGINPLAAIYVPSMGAVDPWEVAIALSENAVVNGVTYMLNTTVADVITEEGEINGVVTDKGIIKAPYIINCAGVYADDISKMAGDRAFTIHPRRGTICISDKNIKSFNRAFRLITPEHQMGSQASSKGGGMATTIAKNNLTGPSAVEVFDKEDFETTRSDMLYALSCNAQPEFNVQSLIKIFAGSRPATYTEDFFIEMSPIIHGLLNVAGIQSPGLASAPAIAEMVIDLLMNDLKKRQEVPKIKSDYQPYRKKRIEFRNLSRSEQDALIKEHPEYGKIICRCETITEGELLDVIHSPIVPTTVDAIKRRTRAGMGRCQGGFCQPLVIGLLARELGKSWTDINLKGPGSQILHSENRK